jgi:alpha-galactosidase
MSRWCIIALIISLTSSLLTRATPFQKGDGIINGGKWKILLHSDSKTVDYTYNDQVILAGVYVKAKNQDEYLQSLDYESFTITQTTVTDVFGTGTRFAVTYQKSEKPDLVQVFYFYPDKEYFLTEAYIQSATETSSNYIAPVVTTTQNTFLPEDANNRIVIVPFDNDGFVRYSSWPLTKDSVSFEVTAIFNGTNRKGLVIGSVEHSTWKTGVRFSTSGNKSVNKLECYGGITHALTRDINTNSTSKEHGRIKGICLKSPKVLVGFFNDWRNGMDQYGAANALIAPPRGWKQGTPFGWNSWGGMSTNVNYDGVMNVADYFKNTLQTNDFENDGTVYIGLDAWWNDNITDSQLRSFVKHCKENGQNAGIYYGPFSDWSGNGENYVDGTNGKYKYKDIYLYANGTPRKIESWALDPTHPGTKMAIEYQIRRFQKLGFKYIKLDFINSGILEADSFYVDSITTGVQAYNNGMKFLSDLCGDSIFLALSIAPTFPAQYGNSKRISCDTWGDMSESDAATGYELNSLSFGWWLDKVYDFNDADHLVLDGRTEGANRARVTSGVITGIYMLGDNLSQAGTYIGSATAREKTEKFATNKDINDIARLGQSFYPVEGYMAAAPNRAENLFMLNTDDCVYVAVFNYTILTKSGSIELDRLGLTTNDVAGIKELWSGDAVELNGTKLPYSVPFQDVKVYQIQKVGSGVGQNTENTSNNQLRCYMDPDHSTLIVDSGETLKTIRIVAMDGRIIPAKTVESDDNYALQVNSLTSGVYVVWAQTKTGQWKTTKFIR